MNVAIWPAQLPESGICELQQVRQISGARVVSTVDHDSRSRSKVERLDILEEGSTNDPVNPGPEQRGSAE